MVQQLFSEYYTTQGCSRDVFKNMFCLVIKGEGFGSLFKKTGHGLGAFCFILVKDICDFGVHPWPPSGLVGNTFV